MIRALILWLDERLGAAPFVRGALRKAFPDHWSFMLGEIALYAFLVLLATGTWIAFQFDDSDARVVYHGAFASLNGRLVSSAYASTLRISSIVPLGLLVRQAHHWAALIFLCAIVAHMARIFFTGAFRKPRELNWVVGLTLMILAMAEGFTGYSLPDDLLSGTGLRIAHSIVLAFPVLGTWFAFLLFGGKYPTALITDRLFIVHVLLIPGILIAAIGAHLGMVWRQKHTQFPGSRRTEGNVVGSPLWPHYTLRSIALGFAVFGVAMLLGGVAQINPIWLYGPYDPWTVASPAQPDWYVGWLDGALRLGPSWEPHLGPFTIPSPFWSGLLLPAVMFVILYAWPLIERRFTKDERRHELLDLPYESPWRTTLGVAFFTFAFVLLLAGSDDVQAALFRIPVERMADFYRSALVALPIAFGTIAFSVCHELRIRARLPDELHPKQVALVRTASGGYEVERGAEAE